jgi:hypothetical protein
MTDYSDFTTQIAEWANREDWAPALVASFVAMANEKLNQELRVSRMIQSVIGTVINRCAMLPDDWLEFDLVLVASPNSQGGWSPAGSSPGGWMPIHYKPRDEFFKLPDSYAVNHYTIEGREIFFGGTPDAVEGLQFQLYYFAEVPAFSDTVDSWVYTKYPNLYLSAALMHAYLHAVGEEQQAAGAKQLTEDTITKLNNEFKISRASGSKLRRTRRRSFG